MPFKVLGSLVFVNTLDFEKRKRKLKSEKLNVGGEYMMYIVIWLGASV